MKKKVEVLQNSEVPPKAARDRDRDPTSEVSSLHFPGLSEADGGIGMADLEKTKEILFSHPTPEEELLFSHPTPEEEQAKEKQAIERLIHVILSAEQQPSGSFQLSISAEELVGIIAYLQKYLEARQALAASDGLIDAANEALKEAYRIFKEPGTFQKRASNVLKHLGFHSGKRESNFDKSAMMYEYLGLILDGMPKWQAIEKIQLQYGIQSLDATYKMLERIKGETLGLLNKSILPSSIQPTTDKL